MRVAAALQSVLTRRALARGVYSPAFALSTLVLLACEQTNPLVEEYKSHFTEIELPSPAKMRTSGNTIRFEDPKDEVWGEALSVIAQYALVIRTKHWDGTIFFVDVDGVLRDGEHIYLQFPFAVLIEEEAGRTAVYVSPMLDLVREGLSSGELDLATAVSEQKGQEFLAHLSVQLEASDRWPWLVP